MAGSDFQTVNPDQVAEIAAVPADAFVLLASPGGPLQRIAHDRLLAKLIAANLCKASVAALDADLIHGVDTVALVFNDPDAMANGWYRKTGASGLGAWIQFETLALSAWQATIDAAAQVIALLSAQDLGGQTTARAVEAIGPGKFVNFHNVAGVASLRLATASDPARFANGFVPVAIASGAVGVVAFEGINAATGTIAAPAAEVWLSDSVPGGFMADPPTTPGYIAQPLGPAKPGFGIGFTNKGWSLV